MPRHLFNLIACTAVSGLLAACSEATSPAPDPVMSPPEAAPAVTAEQDNGPSIRTLMNTDIEPHAMTLWQAVRYVATADGVEEDIAPESAEDWQQLADSAFALIAAGDQLLAEGLQPDTAPPDADYKFTGPEIRELLAANPDGWRYYVEEMQFATNATLEAIVRRDIIGLMESGATINNACNGCHAGFWYRPLE